MSPNLKALIDKHPTLSHKEVIVDEQIMVVFFLIVKDDGGHDCFDEFFVTDLQGKQLSLSSETYYEINKLI